MIVVTVSALPGTHMRINSSAAAKRAADQVETILAKATLAQLKVNTVLSPSARRSSIGWRAVSPRSRKRSVDVLGRSETSADVGCKVSKVDARRYV